MNRLLVFVILSLACQFNALAQSFETATEAVKNMGLGWNLGNTLDAYNSKVTDVTSTTYWGRQGVDSETCWGQRETQKPLMTMMKNAGFGAIRVPVTWFNHMDRDGNVDAAWMARVHEVVDMVLETGLYCIINVHHDTGADSDSFVHWIHADEENYTANKDRFEYLWQQIAEEFKDYDNHLLFEGYNEMLDKNSSWCFASFNATNGYDSSIAQSAYNAINSYAQSFVNTVRATGGNNTQRNLIVNTYAAACGEGTWNTHLTDPLTKMRLPEDNVQKHIIFQVHTYPTIAGKSWSDIKTNINQIIETLKTKLVNKGAPVIFGEWGTSNVDAGSGKTDYDLYRDLMFDFADYFVKKTKANGMGTFYWMGLTDGMYRSYPAFNQPDLAECLAKAYHGNSFEGEYPEYEQSPIVICFEGSKVLSWGDGISIDATTLKNAGEKCQLELSYTQTVRSGDAIQLYYGDWSSKPSFTVNGKSYAGDFNPSTVYKSGANTDHITTMTFSKTVYDKLSTLGLIIHGTGITLKKVVIIDPDAVAGIESPSAFDINNSTSCTYNLQGQLVGPDYKGIVIKNGKKVLSGF